MYEGACAREPAITNTFISQCYILLARITFLFLQRASILAAIFDAGEILTFREPYMYHGTRSVHACVSTRSRMSGR